MAKGLVNDSTLTAIANAIRGKTETTGTMLPSEMAALIQGIAGAKMTYGAHRIPENDIGASMTVEHNLGVVPNVIYVCIVGDDRLSSDLWRLIWSFALWADGTGWMCGTNSKSVFEQYQINSDTISNYVTELTSTSMTLISPNTAKPMRFRTTYYWFVGVKE